MKKLLTALLSVALLLTCLGGAVLAQPAAPSDEDLPAYEAGSAPAETDLWTAMLPPVHALVSAMAENELTYDSDSPLFQWTSLYYMLSLYGQMDDRTQLSDEYMSVPREVVLDYAAPLFPALEQLAEVPDALADRVTYCADEDSYHLSRGDEGLTQMTLTASYPTGSSGRQITGQMVYLETGAVLYTFRAQLAENDSMFGYAITDITLE